MQRSILSLIACSMILSACGEQVVVREKEGLCGNGEVETGEACDDGNEINTDTCTNGCDLAACGDGVTRTDLAVGDNGYEACDDGNTVETDTCLNNCIVAICGDASCALISAKAWWALSPATTATPRMVMPA